MKVANHLLLCALPAAYAALHESLESVPRGWRESREAVSDDSAVNLQIALQYKNINSLESRLKSVSDPSSQDYGKYLDIGDMETIFGPSGGSENAVKAWLQRSDARDISSDGSIVSFTMSVGNANQMLQTKLKRYTNGVSSRVRTTHYSIPDDLVDAIDFVHPTTFFGDANKLPKARQSSQATSAEDFSPSQTEFSKACETSAEFQNKTFKLLTPDCVKELYNVGNYTPDAKSGSTIAFGSFLNQTASHSDLAIFEKKLGLPQHDFTVLKLINGGKERGSQNPVDDGEANLDCQNIAGLVGELPIGEYITGGLPPFVPDVQSPNKSTEENEPYLPYYQYLLSQPNSNLPYVISNSYSDNEDTVPEKYAKRVCNMIGMMGLRGRTIFECTGDQGTGTACRANTGAMKKEFTPQFPPTCPYVTSVGGTQALSPEVAWTASGGGFSRYFSTAWYQNTAVDTYLSKYINPVAKHYYTSNDYVNFSGRATPDVSAHSLGPFYYGIYGNGKAEPNGGTSASTPVVASIFSLINDARFRAGKPAMGFVNPWLYSVASQDPFHDIVKGGALGCTGTDLQNGQKYPGSGIIPYASWNATVGWDPATGLGTPDFMKLKDIALMS